MGRIVANIASGGAAKAGDSRIEAALEKVQAFQIFLPILAKHLLELVQNRISDVQVDAVLGLLKFS